MKSEGNFFVNIDVCSLTNIFLLGYFSIFRVLPLCKIKIAEASVMDVAVPIPVFQDFDAWARKMTWKPSLRICTRWIIR